MSRSVDDVDLLSFVVDGGVLRVDGDPSLLFLVVRVHDAGSELLVLGKSSGLLEQCVYESGLPMIDMGDDGDIPI